MYKCRNCGHSFNEDEQKTRYERHNDYYTEPISVCPVCGSDDIEICVYCKCCEDKFFKDELNSKGICSQCVENFISDNAKNEKVCYDIGSKEKTQVEINSFLLDYWGNMENIERHLLEYITSMQEIYRQDFSRYLKETDEDILSEMILDERR